MTRALLALSPDEHACLDFKQNIQPLTDEYLAMMANAAALAGEHHATVLVGVAEEKDPRTGVTSGRIVGLAGDLHKAGETIAGRASNTEPTPVDIAIFEENIGSKPIVRVEITPTAPPHFDQRGRRATRQHSTTRAMSDEEILRLLEAREQRRYAGVAEETASLMMGDFRIVTDEVLQKIDEQGTPSGIDEVLERLGEIYSRIEDLDTRMDELPWQFDPGDQVSMEQTLAALVRARQLGAVAVSMRIGDLRDEEIEAIETVINSPLDLLHYAQNRRELEAWRAVQSAFHDEGSDISAAVRGVVAVHEVGDQPPAVSIREFAAEIRGDEHDQ